eukprot:gene8431-14412_t
MTDVESLSASLVREYLSRKGLKRSLRVLDDEFPRNEDSIRNRVILAKELRIEKLIRLNKEQDTPFRTMIEVMVKHFIEEKRGRASSRQNTVSDDRNERTKQQSISKDAGRDNVPKNSLELDKQLDLALRISNDNISAYKQQAGLKTDRNKDSSPSKSSTVLRPAKSLSDIGSSSEFPNASERHNRGSLKPLSGGSNATSKARNQGAIQNTTEKSRKTKSKKTLSVNTNGLLSNNIDDSASQTTKGPQLEDGILEISPQARVVGKQDLTKTQRTSTGNSMMDNTSLVQKKHAAKEREKPPMDILVFDDVDEEISAESEEVHLGLPANKLISKLHENSAGISMESAINLKKLIFGSSTMSFNQEWRNQSFSFCELPDLGYGIVQIKGGPCGILAAVQATILKHLMFSDNPKAQYNRPPDPSARERTKALVESAANILWRAGGRKGASIVTPSGKSKFLGGGRYKTDGLTETLTINDFNSEENLKAFISQNVGQFESESSSGCILLLYSLVFSRTIKRIKSDMDEPNGTLIGSHGYCTQELVNLCLTGKAVSNVFDGIMELDSGGATKSLLKGIEKQSDIGFLSLFEHYDSCKVGDNYKNPSYPIWVVCSESHFSTLFSINGRLLCERNFPQVFDIYYYDGLARQDEEIRLTIDTQEQYVEDSDDLIPPLEHCIRTKWKDATVDWNTTEPIL